MIRRHRFTMHRRPASVRHAPLLAVVAGLVLVIAAGNGGTPLPHPLAGWFVGTGLAVIAGLGLLAWHMARLTVLPRAEPMAAALAATLIPVLLLPGLGSDALLVCQIVAIGAWLRDHNQRLVVLMVQCGAVLAISPPPLGAMVNALLYVAILGNALFLLLRGLSGAANDNPSMKRGGSESVLMPSHGYARSDSISGSWGVANVQ